MYNLEPIKFSIHGRSYNLKFNLANIMQITGDSSVGKSLFYQDFQDYLRLNGKDSEVLFINDDNKSGIDSIKTKQLLSKYKIVIIDNADILMTIEIEKIILTRTDIYWVIIGRNMYGCVPFSSLGALQVDEKNLFSINYNKKW